MSSDTQTSIGMDKQDLILSLLDEQNRRTTEYRADVKEALLTAQAKTEQTFVGVFNQIALIDGRLTTLEKWQQRLTGAFGLFVLVTGWYVTWKAGH